MENFFTTVKTVQPQYSIGTLLILNIVLLAATLFTIHRMGREGNKRPFMITLACLQLFELISINAWYWIADYKAFPLPLYHCRLTKWFLILIIFMNNSEKLRFLRLYAAPTAVMGAIGSFVVPDVDAFDWPHITTVGFFFGHLILMLLGVAVFLDDKTEWTRKDFFTGQKVLLGLNIFITAVARYTGINYAFMLSSPFMKATFAKLHPVLYTLLAYLAYAVVYTISFHVVVAVKRLCQKGLQKTSVQLEAAK